MGEWVDGIYYSNGGIKNYTGYGYSGAYYYRPNDVRHPGGLISVRMFDEKDREKWAKCPSCQGWFRKEKMDGVCSNCAIWLALLKFRKDN